MRLFEVSAPVLRMTKEIHAFLVDVEVDQIRGDIDDLFSITWPTAHNSVAGSRAILSPGLRTACRALG